MNRRMLAAALALLMFSAPAWAVDLVGVHDLALQNDPRLQAAASRLEATRENKSIARANLLPQIGGSASMSRACLDSTVSSVRHRTIYRTSRSCK